MNNGFKNSPRKPGRFSVLETHLTAREFIVDRYSIADIAIWPWIARHAFHRIDLNDYPAVREWYTRLAQRPAVQRGYAVPHAVGEIPQPVAAQPVAGVEK